MFINFQQNWISRLVKTVHTNLFAKNCRLHQLAIKLKKKILEITPFGHALPPNGYSGQI